MSGKINYNSGWLNLAEAYELRTELAEFKLLELSLGKRIENLVSDVDEHEAKNQALLEALKKILRQAISSGLDYLFVLDIIDSAREAIQENQNE